MYEEISKNKDIKSQSHINIKEYACDLLLALQETYNSKDIKAVKSMFNVLNMRNKEIRVYCETLHMVDIEYAHSATKKTILHFSAINKPSISYTELVSILSEVLEMSDSLFESTDKNKYTVELILSARYRLYISKLHVGDVSILTDESREKLPAKASDAVNLINTLLSKQKCVDTILTSEKCLLDVYEDTQVTHLIDNNKYKRVVCISDASLTVFNRVNVYKNSSEEFFYVANSEKMRRFIVENIEIYNRALEFVYLTGSEKGEKIKEVVSDEWYYKKLYSDSFKDLGLKIEPIEPIEYDGTYCTKYKNLVLHSPDSDILCRRYLLYTLLQCMLFTANSLDKVKNIDFVVPDMVFSFKDTFILYVSRTSNYTPVIHLSTAKSRDEYIYGQGIGKYDDLSSLVHSQGNLSDLLNRKSYLHRPTLQFSVNEDMYKVFYTPDGISKSIVCILKNNKECLPTKEILEYIQLYE